VNKLFPAQSSIGARVALFTVIRSVINSAYRMAYAMQPLLAAGMGVKLSDLAVALSIRSLLGVFSPFLAIFTDTQGRKKGMTLGLALFFISFEVTLLSLVTLMTEVLPSARATVMAVTVATFSAGRVFGSLLGARLYQVSFWMICVAAVALDFLAVWLVQRIKTKTQPTYADWVN
jgi:predicted MFS family arabinose efflux permease